MHLFKRNENFNMKKITKKEFTSNMLGFLLHVLEDQKIKNGKFTLSCIPNQVEIEKKEGTDVIKILEAAQNDLLKLLVDNKILKKEKKGTFTITGADFAQKIPDLYYKIHSCK